MSIENHELGLRKIRRALVSVSDKTGIVALAAALKYYGVQLISTGGTAKLLRENNIEVSDIADVTGFPEMMGGRVKTLHPLVHGALLALRDDDGHVAAMQAHGIVPIDMLVVNLYPFEETIARGDVTLEDAIEQIDIGGPSMIRSAAKNFRDVAAVTSPNLYARIVDELNQHDGALTLATRSRLAVVAFERTAVYDATIHPYLRSHVTNGAISGSDDLPESVPLSMSKVASLRYGENPHQSAALYRINNANAEGIASAELLGGKEMSFNNYVDAEAALQLVCDFNELACAIIKHTNPAGVGLGATPEEAYRKALATDPVSAFGGIVALNRTVDDEAARAITRIFTEVVIAPGFSDAALEILRSKKNLRVVRADCVDDGGPEYKQISGGMLLQTRDTHRLDSSHLKVITKRAPTEEELRALRFAWTVCKHTKSNAIVYARDGQTVGVGAGQMSRVDSVKIGAMRAKLELHGTVLASDAFFPFRDGVDEAAGHGITAIIQPGGSVRDEEVIDAANEHDLAMVFTGIRHFKH